MNDLDFVELLTDVEPMSPGARGTIVHVHGEGAAFEVEFCDREGRTLALLTLTPEQIRRSV